MRELNTTELDSVAGGTFGCLAALLSFLCKPITRCKPAPVCPPPKPSCGGGAQPS